MSKSLKDIELKLDELGLSDDEVRIFKGEKCLCPFQKEEAYPKVKSL